MSITIQQNRAARELFLQKSFGVLSTISLAMPGYPFGSVTPYCADNQCRPIMTGIDADGFDVLKSGKKLRFTFETPIRNMEEARQALVSMAKLQDWPRLVKVPLLYKKEHPGRPMSEIVKGCPEIE